MLKILQARLQQYLNHELPDVQADLEKAEGNRDLSVIFEIATEQLHSSHTLAK